MLLLHVAFSTLFVLFQPKVIMDRVVGRSEGRSPTALGANTFSRERPSPTDRQALEKDAPVGTAPRQRRRDRTQRLSRDPMRLGLGNRARLLAPVAVLKTLAAED